MPSVKEQKIAGGGRICFRGDSRHPLTVFSRGMSPRDKISEIEYREARNEPIPVHAEHKKFYSDAGLNLSQSRDPAVLFPAPSDITPETAVCVTARFSLAPLFPLKNHPDDKVKAETWIYTVYARSLFNTHAQQALDAINALEKESGVRQKIETFSSKPNRTNPLTFDKYAKSKALSLLYAHELATKSINGRDVICAIKCTREWHGDSWTEGAKYTLMRGSLTFNPFSNAPKAVSAAVREFIKKEPGTGEIPIQTSGFYKGQSAFFEVSQVERRIEEHMSQLRTIGK